MTPTGNSINQRGSGIPLHVTSLPSPYGIGDMGPSARGFLDFLKESRQRYWQILPLNPTDSIHSDSTYNSVSSFAGNPLLISPDLLLRDEFLSSAERAAALREMTELYARTGKEKEE
jgi:4-alpha-glucanotransferase